MRILSWNINGIRASKIDLKKLFDSLNADVICLQETKVTRDQLDEPTAIVEGYNSYFSYSKKRSGYSGVANFCRDTATPIKAEEGLSSLLNPADPREEKIGSYGDVSEFPDDELEALDAEGRTIITQHLIRKKDGEEAKLAIINVYCPRVDPEREDRHMYKMRFLSLLQVRAEALVQDGSHVIILGDLNLSHKKLDNCEFDAETFAKWPSRRWMNQFLWPQGRDPEIMDVDNKSDFVGTTNSCKGGLFVDTFRHLYPLKEEAFSNWCSKTSARQTNFGRRLDYIVADVDLAKNYVKESVVMSDVEGSDHCPVMTEFDVNFSPASKCPQLCTKFLPEFAGKQQKLSTFFTKAVKNHETQVKNSDTNVPLDKNDSDCKLLVVDDKKMKKRASCESDIICVPAKKQKQDMSTKKGAGLSKQSSLMNFFGKQTLKKETNKEVEVKVDESVAMAKTESADKLVEDKDSPISSQESNSSDDKPPAKSSAMAWKNLLKGPPNAPLCKGHKEPCVLRTVKKEGPNKGKQFFVCCRGEGRATNPEARCDHFQWVDRRTK